MVKSIKLLLIISAISFGESNIVSQENQNWVMVSATKVTIEYDSTEDEFEEEKIDNILVVNTATKEILKLNTTLFEHNDSIIDTFVVLGDEIKNTQNEYWKPGISKIKSIVHAVDTTSQKEWITFKADQDIIEYDVDDNDFDTDDIESILFFNTRTCTVIRIFSDDEEIRDIIEDKIDSTTDKCGSIVDVTYESNVKSIRLFTNTCPPVLLNAKKEFHLNEYNEQKWFRNGGIGMIIGGSILTTFAIIWSSRHRNDDVDPLGWHIIGGIGLTVAGTVITNIGARRALDHLDEYRRIK